jgi:hypothetical protein
MDKSTLLRRTPAGDAEVRAPASGLSVTQRRILTLLDTPRRVRDLPVGPMLNTARLTRDAARLNRAGLVIYERAGTDELQAANAGSLTPAHRPIVRPLYLLFGIVAVSALVWVEWRFQASPAPSADARAHGGTASAATPAVPSVTPDPPVIATRVLRGDPVKEPRARGSSSAPEAAAPASLPPAAKGAQAPPSASTASGPDVEGDDSHGTAPDP